jgi:hypothetical protein
MDFGLVDACGEEVEPGRTAFTVLTEYTSPIRDAPMRQMSLRNVADHPDIRSHYRRGFNTDIGSVSAGHQNRTQIHPTKYSGKINEKMTFDISDFYKQLYNKNAIRDCCEHLRCFTTGANAPGRSGRPAGQHDGLGASPTNAQSMLGNDPRPCPRECLPEPST